MTDRLLGSHLTRRGGRSAATRTEAALDAATSGRGERQGGAGHRRALQPVDDLHHLAGSLGDVRLGRADELVTSPEKEDHQPMGMTGKGQPRKQLHANLMTHVIAPARAVLPAPRWTHAREKNFYKAFFPLM